MSKNILNTLAADIKAPKDKLLDELRTVVDNAEELLHSTSNQAGEGVVIARARIQESLKAVKARLHHAESAVVERTHEAAKATDHYVHTNPWQSIGISACAGIIIGMLIKRQ